MKRLFNLAVAAVLATLVAACGARTVNLPGGSDAYSSLATVTEPTVGEQYRIGLGDTLRVNVFQEPDVSLPDAVVDADGNVTIPLIGDVKAAGLTNRGLSDDIATRLRRYLVNPQVTVAVTRAVAYRVFVEGDVNKPGAYALQGDVSLVGALAMAEGVTDVADTRQVLIFRTIEGKRHGAKFDLNAIRGGEAADPGIRPQDVVIVGTSSSKQWIKNLIQLSPVLGSVFIALNQN
jgi:polysaccharide biosynthesis/export protein